MKNIFWKSRKKQVSFALAGFAFFFATLRAFAADSGTRGASDGQSGSLPEVLIEAEHNKPLSLQKPPFDFQVEEDAPIETLLKKTDRSMMDRLPREIIKSNVFEPGISISSKAIVPLHLWIARPWLGEPAHIFHPQKILTSAHAFKDDREERKKSTWNLDVVDSEGKSFRHFSGLGIVPERLIFDGKSDEGKWIAAGETYMGVLKVSDSKGHIHTAYGHSFKLAGISLKENDVFLVSLDAGVLFSTTSARPQFSPFGQELMAEGTQLLQRYYPGFAVNVNLQDDRFDAARIQEAALLCAKDVARRLIKRSSDIKTQWTEKVSGVEATLNLSIHSK